jgi:Family of unknown function (DUF5947)
MTASGLRRFTERPQARPAGERCELCGNPIGEPHSHVVNLTRRNILCTCRACYLLFTHQGAAQGRYRAVPDRYLHDPSFQVSEARWDALGIPVGMAFFFRNSSLDRILAFYPSPAGATESELPGAAWEELIEGNAELATMERDVEALLVRRQGRAFESYLVPIDVCYELVGLVRLHWRGFDGGEEARRAIDEHFERLRARSRPMRRGDQADQADQGDQGDQGDHRGDRHHGDRGGAP